MEVFEANDHPVHNKVNDTARSVSTGVVPAVNPTPWFLLIVYDLPNWRLNAFNVSSGGVHICVCLFNKSYTIYCGYDRVGRIPRNGYLTHNKRKETSTPRLVRPWRSAHKSQNPWRFSKKKCIRNWVSGAIGRPAGPDEVKVIKQSFCHCMYSINIYIRYGV